MRLHESLFVSENIQNIGTIVYSLRRNIPVLRLYCIVWFAASARMEILSSKELFTQKHQNKDGMIVGIAMGQMQALDLLRHMAQTAIIEGRDVTNVAQWFAENNNRECNE